MNTVGDLLDPSRRSEDTALRTMGDSPRAYDYRRLRATAWKTGNFLRRLGVREGAMVTIAPDRAPEAILAFLGANLLGATVAFAPPGETDARVTVAPLGQVTGEDLPTGGQGVAYGGRPDDPRVRQFEEAVWSENPTFPETDVSPDAPALATGERTFSHGDLLDAARAVADDWKPSPGEAVAVRAPLTRPEAVSAGVVAPLLAGGTVLLPGEESVGEFAVADGDAPEGRVMQVGDVPL